MNYYHIYDLLSSFVFMLKYKSLKPLFNAVFVFGDCCYDFICGTMEPKNVTHCDCNVGVKPPGLLDLGFIVFAPT